MTPRAETVAARDRALVEAARRTRAAGLPWELLRWTPCPRCGGTPGLNECRCRIGNQ